MKKIFLCLLCGILLVGVTGCGNEKENKNTDNTPKENNEGIAVTDVYATSNNYLVVKADGKVYIIDNEGKKQGTLDITVDDKTIITINDDGYVYYGVSNGEHNIYDKTGKTVLESNDDETYQYVSAEHYTIKSSKVSDFENGTSSKREIVDFNGKVIKELNPEFSQYYLGGNIWHIYDEEDHWLYNEVTKEQNNDEDYFDRYYISGPDSNMAIPITDGGVFFNEHSFITADLKYTYDENIIYVSSDYYYNNEDYSIYSYDGTKVKEFTSGDGFSHIFSIDNIYYVESGTGYFYTLDKDLNQNEEPYELEDSITGRTVAVGNNCILSDDKVNFNEDGYEGTWDHFYLYDYKGKLLEDIGEGFNSYSEVNNYIIRLNSMSHTEYSETSGNRETTDIGPQESDKFVNLLTGEILKVY